jgi:hypothetical protein
MNSFDPTEKDSYFFVDSHGMMAMQNPAWNPDGNNGKRDSIGRTFMAWFTWQHRPFIEAVKGCFAVRFDKRGRPFIQGFRHPSLANSSEANDMSRDHVFYALALMKMAGETEALKGLVDGLRWRISKKHSFTPDLWFWMKGLTKGKAHRAIFYAMIIPALFVSVIWNYFLFWVGGFQPEVPQRYFEPCGHNVSRWKRLTRKLFYPVYSLLQVAFMLHLMPDGNAKRLAQRIALHGAPFHNYVIQGLLNGPVNEVEVFRYKPMTEMRWTTHMNCLDDRGTRIISPDEWPQKNLLDVDLLQAVLKRRRPAREG